jgi:hypothetical protein
MIAQALAQLEALADSAKAIEATVNAVKTGFAPRICKLDRSDAPDVA